MRSTAGKSPDPTTGSRAVPIYQTTSYVFQDADHAARLFGLQEFGNIYTRIMNPTTDVFEKRIAALEGGVAALATASGQAAETLAITNLANSGEEIISTTSLYGGTYNLFHYTLPKYGITVRFADADDFDGIRAAINDKTRAIYTETLGNPKLDIADVETLADIRPRTRPAIDHRQHQRLAGAGAADRVGRRHRRRVGNQIHRRPRHLDRRRDYRCGQVRLEGLRPLPRLHRTRSLVSRPLLHRRIWPSGLHPESAGAGTARYRRRHYRRSIPSCSCKASRRFHLRMERHSQNALAVAKFLEEHPGVEWVNYPGLPSSKYYGRAKKYLPDGQSGLVTFGIKGGYEAGKKLINSLKLFSLLANIGDAKSLVIHPASTTHQQLSSEEQLSTGVSPELVRLSVGIEDLRDIVADLDQAIETANGHSALKPEALAAQ